MSKERTIDELRQVKTYGYTTPKTKVVNEYYRKVNFDNSIHCRFNYGTP